jgi:formylglycine-generating enzyme required for sulfatase activity
VTGEKDGKATAEVAHEILLKTWPTLKRWLEDERDFLVWRGELGARRQEYEKAAQASARQQRQALLMGLPLDTAKKWLAARRGDIEPADQALIKASVQAERAVARNRQRLQAAVGVLMLGTIAGLLGVIYKEEINNVRFEYFTVRPYIAANFTPYVLKQEDERALKPGDTFRECAEDCPEMVVIPPGEFWMGSPDGGGHDNERPRHKVKIDKPLAVGKFEVTWDDWEACVAMRGCDGRPTTDSGYGKGRQPLINVSWDQAKAYMAWLSRTTGKTYRLLTEAEWEYAARGLTSADAPHPPYPWGDKASHATTAQTSAARARSRAPTSGYTRRRWDSFHRTPSVSTTCLATSLSGSRIAITTIMRAGPRRMVRCGSRATARTGSCAAGPGSTIRTASARPTAAGSPPTTGSTTWASGSAGRLAPEPLPLYLRGPGAKPLVEFFLRTLSKRCRATGLPL